MSDTIICYCTGAGHTRRLAEHIARGASSAALLDVETIADEDWARLHAARAILFGAPTYMGSAAGAFKTFMDATSDFWLDQLWQNKIAGGFTTGSANAGDKSLTLMSFATLAAQHGMIWVGQAEIGPPANTSNGEINRDGFWLGLAATASRDKSELIMPADAETARRYGVRIAEAVARWGKGTAN
ncbi:MAG: flavodoxin family protein [Marinovum sp.]|nr:flavodoxin family protein [Marinovum sp.]